MPLRQLILGGSFNPIHHGHLICARAAAERAGFDRVLLMPSALPPHKKGQELADLAPAADRLRMCQLAIEESSAFAVSDLELSRLGPSFTLDTARELRRQGWEEVPWLIGADMLRTLPTWHRPEQLLSEVHFIPIARPGWSFDWEQLPPAFRSLQSRLIEVPQIDISATDIRQRLAAGKDIEYLTPAGVREYIREKGLYQGS